MYSTSNSVRVIKSSKMRWVGDVARNVGKERCIQGFGGQPEETISLGNPRPTWKCSVSTFEPVARFSLNLA